MPDQIVTDSSQLPQPDEDDGGNAEAPAEPSDEEEVQGEEGDE